MGRRRTHVVPIRLNRTHPSLRQRVTPEPSLNKVEIHDGELKEKPTRAEGDLEMLEVMEVEKLVIEALKSVTTVQEAPAIITVYTAKELKDMGHQVIGDAVQDIPSLLQHWPYGQSGQGFINRGIQMGALVLHNTVDVFDIAGGGSLPLGEDKPIETVRRIEIISGPGGVLWGVNSFVGVINIVSKTADHLQGVEASAGYGGGRGKPDTFRAYVMGGKKLWSSGHPPGRRGGTDPGLRVYSPIMNGIQTTQRGWCAVACLTAGLSVGAGCTKGVEAEKKAMEKIVFQEIKHTVYPVTVQIPETWKAEQMRSERIPCDTWFFYPQGKRRERGAPRLIIKLGWKPRPGRFSAGYPGGRMKDVHPETVVIAGREIRGSAEDKDRHLMADFDVGELNVSMNAKVPSKKHRLLVFEILKRMKIDADARPQNWPSEERVALDVASASAKKEKLDGPRIVWVGRAKRPHTHHLTVFFKGGLRALLIDASQKKVLEVDGRPHAP